MSLRALMARVQRDKARRRAERVALLRVMGGTPLPFWCPSSSRGYVVAVHRDTYAATVGQWRVTNFMFGQPVAHRTRPSFGAVVDIAQTEFKARLCLARHLSVEP